MIILKVINDSDTYATFKKNKAIRQAESINNLDCIVNKSTVEQEIPPHLQAMYESNISELSVEQKSEFKKPTVTISGYFLKG